MTKYFYIFLTVTLLGACSVKNDIDEIRPSKPYTQILSDIGNKKKDLKAAYLSANETQKKEIISQARTYIFDQLRLEIFPSWYGTNWEFYGTTETPKEGSIACGYFVTTTFRDVGFDIPRVAWAQAASEQMILGATDEVKRFSNAKMVTVEQWLLSQEDAIYMVGLDNHTGYVYKKGAELTFVHSSPFNSAHGVIAEPANGKNPLSDSGYRVFGKLLTDKMIVKWLNDEKF